RQRVEPRSGHHGATVPSRSNITVGEGRQTGMAMSRMRRTAALLSAAALLTACQAHARPRLTPVAHPATHPAGTTQAHAATPPPTPTPSPASVRSGVTHRLAAIARRLPPGAISIAALNTRTGAAYDWDARRAMWTGSVYKLFVLEALLL